MPNNITAPRVPLTDPKTGEITKEWFKFLANLFVLTGGGGGSTSIPDLEQRPHFGELSAKIAEMEKSIQSLSLSPPTVPSSDAIPTGAIFFYLAAACPSGYTEVVALRSKFPRGMPSGGTAGVTGGADTHVHTVTVNNNATGQNLHDGTGTISTLVPSPHTHNASVDTQNNIPAYVQGLWCQKS